MAPKPKILLYAFIFWLGSATLALLLALGALHVGYQLVALVWAIHLGWGFLLLPLFLVAGWAGDPVNYRIALAMAVVGTGVSLAGLASSAGAFAPLQEDLRVRSPSGRFEAVAGVQPTPATAPAFTKVYVVPKGAPAAGGEVFNADRVDGLSLEWRGDRTLVVRAAKAENPVMRPSVQVGAPWGPKVEVDYRIGPDHQGSR